MATTRETRTARATARRASWHLTTAALVALAVALAIAGVLLGHNGSDATTTGLPQTSDYHSLLIEPKNANALVLGTHEGLFRSTDGGRRWVRAELDGRDAMNLSRAGATTIWAAGHNVLSQSTDGGETWEEVRPSGLPSLDVHGFAVDPGDPTRLYAAIAGEGLYVSRDGGRTFALVSSDVGSGVMALAVLRDGTVLAGDMQRHSLAASDDNGSSWQVLVEAPVMGLAANPVRPRLVLAAGSGVLRSTDAGRTWRRVLALDVGAGPVAWSQSEPSVAYVVAFDRALLRSDDFGATWSEVAAGDGEDG